MQRDILRRRGAGRRAVPSTTAARLYPALLQGGVLAVEHGQEAGAGFCAAAAGGLGNPSELQV